MRDFTVIAHRGASGYLPEHTLEGVAMAHSMGSDYIEQDAVLTRDNVLIVLHDLFLDAVTDVAKRFPDRERQDGYHYAIDFTLDEIKTLHVHERVRADGQPGIAHLCSNQDTIFRVPTLEEEITLIQDLNRASGKNTGVYVEPKSPAWHAAEGRDLVKAVITLLAGFGYTKRQDKACLQSFDPHYLEYARNELNTDLKLVQLIGENSWGECDADYAYLQTEKGLQDIARFADGIGPWLMQIVHIRNDKIADISDVVTLAQRLGLFVHAYTLRTDELPPEIGDMLSAVQFLRDRAGLDGVFTDYPDQVIQSIQQLG